MQVLLDTNVMLDALLKRQPFVTEAQQILHAHEQATITAYLTATRLTDIYYLARKALGKEQTMKAIKLCLDTFQICPVNGASLQKAVDIEGIDFEDNLQIACALEVRLDAIVTRNKADFKTTAIAVMEPAELLSQLSTASGGTANLQSPQS